MPNENFEENLSTNETQTAEAEEEEIKADEFFQQEGLSEKEREIALLALKNLNEGKGGEKHIGMEHIKGVSRQTLQKIFRAVEKWSEAEKDRE